MFDIKKSVEEEKALRKEIRGKLAQWVEHNVDKELNELVRTNSKDSTFSFEKWENCKLFFDHGIQYEDIFKQVLEYVDFVNSYNHNSGYFIKAYGFAELLKKGFTTPDKFELEIKKKND